MLDFLNRPTIWNIGSSFLIAQIIIRKIHGEIQLAIISFILGWDVYPSKDKCLIAFCLFFSGASTISGFFAAACSLPFDYVKTQIQKMQPDAEGKLPYTGSLDCALKTLKNGGPLKFYTGFPVYCVRIAPHVMVPSLSLYICICVCVCARACKYWCWVLNLIFLGVRSMALAPHWAICWMITFPQSVYRSCIIFHVFSDFWMFFETKAWLLLLCLCRWLGFSSTRFKSCRNLSVYSFSAGMEISVWVKL